MSLSNLLQDNGYSLKAGSLAVKEGVSASSITSSGTVTCDSLVQNAGVGNFGFVNLGDDAFNFRSSDANGTSTTTRIFFGQGSQTSSGVFIKANPDGSGDNGQIGINKEGQTTINLDGGSGDITATGTITGNSTGNFTGSHVGDVKKGDEKKLKLGMVMGISKASVTEEALHSCSFEFKVAESGDVPFGVMGQVLDD